MDPSTTTSSAIGQNQPTTEANIFSSLDFDMDSTSSPLPSNGNREDSLSDVDVDLEDLEAIPEDFVAPMLDEDGSPIQINSDSDSDITNTNNNSNEDANRQTSPEDTIRNLAIEVQGHTSSHLIENNPNFFPTLSNRSPLSNITIISSYHNAKGAAFRGGNGRRAPQLPAATRIRMHRREIESRMRMRGRGGPRTVTLWGRENLNKENRRKALPLVNRRMGPRLGTFQEGWTRVMR